MTTLQRPRSLCLLLSLCPSACAVFGSGTTRGNCTTTSQHSPLSLVIDCKIKCMICQIYSPKWSNGSSLAPKNTRAPFKDKVYIFQVSLACAHQGASPRRPDRLTAADDALSSGRVHTREANAAIVRGEKRYTIYTFPVTEVGIAMTPWCNHLNRFRRDQGWSWSLGLSQDSHAPLGSFPFESQKSPNLISFCG